MIELIVVMGIIAFFAGMGLVSFGDSNQISKLRQEKDRVVDALDFAKKKSLAPDRMTCNTNEEVAYIFESNATSFLVKECCKSIADDTLGTCISPITSYTFPTNINKTAGAPTIIFYSLSKGSNGATGGNTLRLKNTSISKCLDVSVSTSGAITVSNLITPC